MSKRKNLLSALAMLCVVPLAACSGIHADNGDGGDAMGHTHTAATSYKYDENGHYHPCDKCDENVMFGYALHEYEEKDGVKTCKVCGYSYALPVVEYDELAKTLISGIRNFLSYDGDLSYKAELMEGESVNEAKKGLSKKNYDATYDSTNNLYCLQQTKTAIEYNDKNEISNSSTENLLFYVSNDDASGYKYFGKYSDDNKTVCGADKGVARLAFLDDFDDLGANDFLEVINGATSFDEMEDAFNDLAEIEDVVTDSSIASVDDGTVIYTIELSFSEVYDNEIESCMYRVVFSVKDDFLSEIDLYSDRHQLSPSGKDRIEYYGSKAALQKGFDKTLYDSNKPTESEYTVSSHSYTVSIPLYVGEYQWNCIGAYTGEAYNWSNDYRHQYADLYLDKDCTVPYTDQILDTSVGALYAKPKDPASDRAFIWQFIDKDYKSADLDLVRNIKEVEDVLYRSAPDVFEPDYISHGNSKYCGTKLSIDGVDVVSAQIQIEAGKSYFLYWKCARFVY